VAKECWEWLINPVGIKEFQEQIMGKQVMVIKRNQNFSFAQKESEDDIMSWEMVRQYVK